MPVVGFGLITDPVGKGMFTGLMRQCCQLGGPAPGGRPETVDRGMFPELISVGQFLLNERHPEAHTVGDGFV